jgi:phosphate starvation-inducible membrane PsiE
VLGLRCEVSGITNVIRIMVTRMETAPLINLFGSKKTSISKHPQKENILIKFIFFIFYTLKIEKLKSNIDIKYIMCHLQI